MNKIDNITKTVKNIVGSWTSDNTIKPDVNVYRKFNYSIFVSNCISTFLKNKIQNKEVENTKNFINLLSLEDLNLLNLEEISLGEGHIDILFEKSNLELFVTFGIDDIEYMTCLDNLDDDKYYYRNIEKIDYSNFIEIPKLLRKELDKIRNYGK